MPKIRLSEPQRRLLDAVGPAQRIWAQAGESMGAIVPVGIKRAGVIISALRRKGVFDDKDQLTEAGALAWLGK
jgi:hypothetical protein